MSDKLQNLQNLDKQDLSELLKHLKNTIDQSKNMAKLANFIPNEPTTALLNRFQSKKMPSYFNNTAIDNTAKRDKIREQTIKLATSQYLDLQLKSDLTTNIAKKNKLQ